MHKSYSPPTDWQAFERLCKDLYAAEWKDRSAQLNGRNGDDQAGVDVFGRDEDQHVGVQCKLKDQWCESRLTAGEIRHEAIKATQPRKGTANPRHLDLLVIATTSVRTQNAQDEADRLTDGAIVPFAVRVDSWDEISDLLNKHTEVADQHMNNGSTDQQFILERDNYLQSLSEKLSSLPMMAIHKDQEKAPTLDEVYTALDVDYHLDIQDHPSDESTEAMVEAARLKSPDDTSSSLTANPYIRKRLEHLRKLNKAADSSEETPKLPNRRLRAVELLAAEQYTVILGPPGSGKSAFVSYVALCLAGERNGATEGSNTPKASLHCLANGIEQEQLSDEAIWPFGALIPLVIDLRAFSRDKSAFPKQNEDVDASHFLRHLNSTSARYPVPDSFLPFLRAELSNQPKGQGVLLLLDGLDETSVHGEVRARLKAAIDAFTKQYPNARIVVTSRPYAYRSDADWRLPNFQDVTLSELTQPSIESFVHAWYHVLAKSGTLGTTDVSNRPQQLLERLGERSMKPLARRPLTLTLVTSLHASGMMRDGGRAEVYDRSVELFFDRWNEVRLGQDEESFLERFGLERSTVLEALQRIAFRIHTEQEESSSNGDEEREAAQIPLTMIWDELEQARNGAKCVPQAELLEHLDHRNGILLAEGNHMFRFPHRSFQEYLAAKHLSDDENFPDMLVETVRRDPTHWREVLAFSILGFAGSRYVWDAVSELLGESSQEAPDDDTLRIAIVLASAFAESSKLCPLPVNAKKKHQRTNAQLQTLLVQCLDKGALTSTDRIEAGRALGRLGDTRLSVGWEQNLRPVGDTGHALGRFLVTVQEYEAFVNAEDYADARYWDPDGGNSQRQENNWNEPARWKAQLEHRNSPVVGVSWYEAAAYCRWLSHTSDIEVQLPESELRVFAARPDDREWPWGGKQEPSEELANYDGNVGTVTPVGCYAEGAGEFGHLDLAGNAWEWCSDEGSRGATRLIRGGAWDFGANDLRAGIVLDFRAYLRFVVLGFRVCAPASR